MLRPWKVEIQIDHQSAKAIYLQVADAIIADIQSGRLRTGNALPGSRILAKDLNLNRNTIVEALNVLINEEWIVSKERKGAFVADVLPVKNNRHQTPTVSAINASDKTALQIVFDDGHPDSKIAPIKELARAYRQIFNRNARWQMMGYGDELGNLSFRKAIAQMLNHQRSMQITEHQICITRGSQMAMYLTAQCLLNKGDYIMMENPGYKPAWEAFERAGAQLLPVRIDEEGLLIEDVSKHLNSGKKIKAIYTTPHHQYPTTVTLSLQRRMELVRLSNQHGFAIIEDDYDNEFHFGYRPVFPLASFTGLKNYVYIGTLSKVVAPALRIGYLVSNIPTLINKVGELRKIIDVQSDAIMEQAILQLIDDGTIRKHIRRTTHLYKAKRDITADLLTKHLGSLVSYTIPDGGLAFWIVPLRTPDWQKIAEALRKKGIKIITPDSYSYKKTTNGIRLGYASLSAMQLEEAIKALALMLK